jgi:hypothetical protein
MSCIPIQDFSLISLCDATKAGKLYSIVPDDGSGDFDVARNSTATYVGADGLIKTAAIDEPRIEFNPDGSYKGLLVEPQRTNLALYSEQFDNAVWLTDGNGAGEIKTANFSISPDGTQNADRIQLNRTGGTFSRLRQDKVVTGTHTGSIYLKSNTGASQKILMRVGGGATTKITITTSWQRFVVSANSSTSFELIIDNTDAEIATIADFSAWGAQLEAGATASSYIPTVASTVTRVADVVSKTGISSLIGQTEGVVLFRPLFDTPTEIHVLGQNLTVTNQQIKIEYSASQIKYYLNDTLVATKTGTFDFSGTDEIQLGHYENGSQLDAHIQNFALI